MNTTEASQPAAPLVSGQYVFVFTDLVDSTRLTFTLPPQTWGQARDRFFALQSRVARDHQLLWLTPRGDGKFLVFRRETDALHFAAALLRAIPESDWHGVPIAIRIGIAAGFADWLPSETGEVQHDFVGHPLNLAARICAAARPGEALLASAIPASMEAEADGEAFGFADLGEIALKGLPPERVFRLAAAGLPQDFPPLIQHGNLDDFPTHSAFFGREQAIAVTADALTDRLPLVTLIGTPGLGKTRLALEVGRRVRDAFQDGVWFIPLEHVRQGTLVPETVASRLGIAAQPGRDLGDVVLQSLKPRQALLILDNCEQLLADETDEGLLDFVEGLLRACPRMRLLATSRQALDLGAGFERILPLSDLSVPPPEADHDLQRLAEHSSARLLCDRLSLASGGQFRLSGETAPYVATICRALDGVPLYLELAAGQLGRARTLPQIAHDVYDMLQTRDRGYADRQRTLDKLLDFSCDQMTPGTRDLLFRLGVFSGGFRAEDAAAVCETEQAEAGLRLLVSRSLVKSDAGEDYLADAPRYRLLQAPTAYARHHLGAELAGWQRRHAEYFLAFARARDARLKGPQQREAAEELSEALPNLRAGMDWAAAAGADALVADYGEALARFLFTRTLTVEGHQRVSTALQAARRTGAPAAIACGLSWSATFRRQRGEAAAAQALEEDAVVLWREAGDAAGEAASLNALGVLAQAAGDYARAHSYHEQARALFGAAGDAWGEAQCLNHLGQSAERQGRLGEARALQEHSRRLRAQIGDLRGLGNSLAALGIIAYHEADHRAAGDFYEQALAVKRGLGDRDGEAWGLYARGYIAKETGDMGGAHDLFQAARVIYQGLGLRRQESECLTRLADLAVETGDLTTARPLAEQALAGFRDLGERRGVAEALYVLADIAFQEGLFKRAGELGEESLQLRRALGVPIDIAASLSLLGGNLRAQGSLEAAGACLGEALQIFASAKSERSVGIMLREVGLLAHQAGDPQTADLLSAAARALFAELGLPPDAQDSQEAPVPTPHLQGSGSAPVLTRDQAVAFALEWITREQRAGQAADHDSKQTGEHHMSIRPPLCRFLLLAAVFLLPATAAPAQQQQANGPYLNYSVTSNPQTGTEDITFTLYGFTNDPSVTPSGVIVDPAAYQAHTIYAFQEKSFEQLGGTVAEVRTPQGWTFYPDSAHSGGPIYPTDPVGGFIVRATSPARPDGRQIHLYDQTYSFYNKPLNFDGTAQPGSLIAFGKPCPNGQACYGAIVSTPEPSGLAAFALTGSTVLGLVFCRRRRAA